jgi:hypothetical protein
MIKSSHSTRREEDIKLNSSMQFSHVPVKREVKQEKKTNGKEKRGPVL